MNFNIFGFFFRKMNIFWVLRFCDFFFFFLRGGGGVITILDYIKGPYLCILGSFLRSMYRMGNTFLVAKVWNLFFFFLRGGGSLEIPDIFFFWGGVER